MLAAILMVAMLLALVIIRWRRRFAWWEFAVMWALVGLGMTIGAAETREAKVYGSDLNPLNLQQTAAVLGYLALPAATFAAAVAEVTVRATVAATRTRSGQAGMAIPDLDCGSLRPPDPMHLADCRTRSCGGRLDCAAVGKRAGRRLRGGRPDRVALSRRQQAVPVVSELGDELGRVGFTIAAALIAVTLPVQVFLSVLQVLASLEPEVRARLSFDITPSSPASSTPAGCWSVWS